MDDPERKCKKEKTEKRAETMNESFAQYVKSEN